VRTLAESARPWPPIIVHRPTMRVIDGVHRVRAAELRGLSMIEAQLFDGDETDAFVLSVWSNVEGGLPLPIADRKAAAARVIKERPQWADRLIASVTGLSAKTVAQLRGSLAPVIDSPAGRIGQDGRVRPVNSAARRKIARDLMLANPGLSLRQVANAAGISPETARTVRARLTCPAEPAPPRPVPAVPARARQIGTEVEARPPMPTAPLASSRGPVDRARAVRQLRLDPALRFTENGRTLLRLLDLHVKGSHQLAGLVDSVPPHCSELLEKVAAECAASWRLFAQRLRQRGHEPMSPRR
jgi:ParB-like chromosome segregation protein Spo0J